MSTETEWEETAEADDNLSRIRELLDGEQLDMDQEYKKRRCRNCFYSVLKKIHPDDYENKRDIKCFYSPGQIGEIAPDFFCGFFLEAGPETIKYRQKFELTVPTWAELYDERTNKREEF